MRYFIPKTGIKAIDKAVEALFSRMKVRFLGKSYEPKQIIFSVKPTKPVQYRENLSMPSIFDLSARAEGVRPNEPLRNSVSGIIEQYLDAHQESAKAKVKAAVQSYMSDVEMGAVEGEVEDVLKKELGEVMAQVTSGVKTVVESELNRSKNISTLDAIAKIGAYSGEGDPTIVFIGPNDNHTCDDCLRLFFLPDGITPRVWKMSEVKNGYGKHKDAAPSVTGHPFCRHVVAPVRPGFGFKGGKITYIDPDYDVFKDQRGIA